MKVKINKLKCLGCGSCVALLPEVFEIDNENLAQVSKLYANISITDPDLISRLKIAQESCPNGAIILE